MAITFDILKPEAKIFQELKKNPSWWAKFKNDSSLYIEIRKGNQVNVYFEGGSVARIHYCSKHKKLQVFTHHKYLNLPAPSKSNAYRWVLLIPTVKNVNYVGLTFCHLLVSFRYKS